MKPSDFFSEIVQPSLARLERWTGLVSDERAAVLLVAIAGQESGWQYRRQIGGPARSYFQFEQGGGVVGVLRHSLAAPMIRRVCDEIDVPCDAYTVYEAMAWNDTLAVAMARLLLWTDPRQLPAVGHDAEGWGYYQDNWRPGAPRPETWKGRYATALLVTGAI